MKQRLFLLPLLLAVAVGLAGCELNIPTAPAASAAPVSLEDIPAYTGSPYIALNGNQPEFEEGDLSLGVLRNVQSIGFSRALRTGLCQHRTGPKRPRRTGKASAACILPRLGTGGYDTVDGGSLYNRCHLIGFQLTGENANEENLITGTRYMNVEKEMLPFENLVADYVKETGNHVLYRSTPVFEGDNLVASGVVMEALSVEDDGEGVCFHVYVYNVQPGIEIDYATGKSWESRQTPEAGESSEPSSGEEREYVLNTSSHKFHLPDCPAVDTMSEKNKEEYFGTREDLIAQGYKSCGSCNP